jgi:hypothetical protein
VTKDPWHDTIMVDTDGTVADLKVNVFPVEREDIEGRGTRSIGGFALRWTDPAGQVHACEAAEIVPEELLLWTLCSKDLPGGVNDYVGEREVTCPRCRAVLASERPRHEQPHLNAANDNEE